MKKVIRVEEARNHFGAPKLLLVLNSGMKKMFDRILPHEVTRFSTEDTTQFEELLHELAHNIAARRTDWNTPLEVKLGCHIRNRFGPVTQDGNEIDAIAVSCVCSQYLGHPLTDTFIDNAIAVGNLKFVGRKLARELVNASMDTPDVRDMSYALCVELLGVIHASTGT